MRHEIIRMEHVNISRPGRHEIEDLNLIICRGYSMGAAGVENSKEILADFSMGKEHSQEDGFTSMENHGSRKENGILRMPVFL